MRPWWRPAFGSVRVTRMQKSAMCASDDHTFCPLITYSLPSFTARVESPARSEPAPGSENPWHHMSSAVRMRFTNRCFCSSVPCAMIVGPAMPRPITFMWSGAPDRANSSMAITWWVTCCS